jgi:hypothetical protein
MANEPDFYEYPIYPVDVVIEDSSDVVSILRDAFRTQPIGMIPEFSDTRRMPTKFTFAISNDSTVIFIPETDTSQVEVEAYTELDVRHYEYFIDEEMISDLRSALKTAGYNTTLDPEVDDGVLKITAVANISDRVMIHNIYLGSSQVGSSTAPLNSAEPRKVLIITDPFETISEVDCDISAELDLFIQEAKKVTKVISDYLESID